MLVPLPELDVEQRMYGTPGMSFYVQALELEIPQATRGLPPPGLDVTQAYFPSPSLPLIGLLSDLA